MKLSNTLVSLSLLYASLSAFASPLKRNGGAVQMGGNSAAVGAAYFITNEASGNFLVSADIGSNGKLTLAQATSVAGRGQHANSTGPDGLFSQGSVKASKNGQVVATINPGSNTAAVFAVNPNRPSQVSMIGFPVSTEGEFPMSLAINKNGSTVCVLNGGAVNGVNCYSVDKTSGLIAKANTLRSLGISQTTPATGPPGSASHIIFNEDETKLIAAVKGTPPTPGFLAVWDIDQADGSLSEEYTHVTPASGGLLPFSLTVIPGQNAIFSADPGLGFDIYDFNDTSIASAQAGQNVTAGGESSANAVSGQNAICWSSRSEKTGNFYLTDAGASMVTEVNVGAGLKPTIVRQYNQTAMSATIDTDIASIGNNDFLYIMAPNATQVQVMALNAPGKATQLQILDIAGPAKKAGLTVSPNNLQGMTTFIKN